MHPDRGIVHTDRRSDGISTRPDYPNNLTRQSVSTNKVPMEPPHSLSYRSRQYSCGTIPTGLFQSTGMLHMVSHRRIIVCPMAVLLASSSLIKSVLHVADL